MSIQCRVLVFCLALICTINIRAESSILVVGDSLSASYGIPVEKGWVALLERRLKQKNLKCDIINASISGATSSQGKAMLPELLKKHKPCITVIELGANDGLRGLPLSLMQRNLQFMIDAAIESNSQVIVLGIRMPPNYGPVYTRQFNQVFADLELKNKNISVIREFLSGVAENRQLMQSDNLHPTAEAQPKLLENVWKETKVLFQDFCR